MITVNLKPGSHANRASRGSALAGMREQFSGMSLGGGGGNPWPAVAAAAWLLVLGGYGFFAWRTSQQITELQPQIAEASSELNRYQAFITEKNQQLAVRDSILQEISVIRHVDRNRYVWPHVLDEVASALPDNTWLTEVRELVPQRGTPIDSTFPPAPMTFRIVGRTGDLHHYTAFQRQLEASPWVGNVLPVEAKVVVENNRALFTFTIQASFTQADSAQVRTVPILQSVVR